MEALLPLSGSCSRCLIVSPVSRMVVAGVGIVAMAAAVEANASSRAMAMAVRSKGRTTTRGGFNKENPAPPGQQGGKSAGRAAWAKRAMTAKGKGK